MAAVKRTVLVVDDTPDEIVVLEAILRDHYRVRVATSGEAALVLARGAPPPDLILLDVVMPGMDGFETCRRLKQDREGAAIPVIFLTVRDGVSDETTGFQVGAVDYIVKPVDPQIVRTRVAAHLEMRDEALRISEVRYRRLFETAEVGILLVDAETGLIVDANPFLVRLLGYPHEAYLGRRIGELAYLAGVTHDGAKLRELVEQGHVAREELSLERSDGRRVGVELAGNAYPVNHRTMIQWSIRDVSERKPAEAEREKLEARLRQAQKMEAVGRLAGGVAHDFNNMLQIISSYAELALADEGLPEPVRAYVRQISSAAQRSASLTRQLLAFARQQTIVPKVLDLNAAVADLLPMLRRLIGEDIDLAWRPVDDLWSVEMDPSQVDQILANLVANARDAIAGVGTVTIETGRVELDGTFCGAHPGFLPGQYATLVVSDDGCGMDKETLARAFEPFFTTKSAGQGTGLGLATVYGIAKQNDGFVAVYSEPGRGTTVRVYLPRRGTPDAPAEKEPAGRQRPSGTETVLLGEDEPALLKLGSALLTELGYAMVPADGPAQALELAREHPEGIDLLVTDLVMPGMDGRELWRRLAELRPGLKCLFMSGYSAGAIAHRGILSRDTHFIQKPFAIQDLATKLREALLGPARKEGDQAP